MPDEPVVPDLPCIHCSKTLHEHQFPLRLCENGTTTWTVEGPPVRQLSAIEAAKDWTAVERDDGSVYVTCGRPDGSYHFAGDVCMDLELAMRFCTAMNDLNAYR